MRLLQVVETIIDIACFSPVKHDLEVLLESFEQLIEVTLVYLDFLLSQPIGLALLDDFDKIQTFELLQ